MIAGPVNTARIQDRIARTKRWWPIRNFLLFIAAAFVTGPSISFSGEATATPKTRKSNATASNKNENATNDGREQANSTAFTEADKSDVNARNLSWATLNSDQIDRPTLAQMIKQGTISNLTSLRIRWLDLNDADIISLRSIENLKRLSIELPESKTKRPRLTDHSLDIITSLKHLEVLCIRGVDFDHESLAKLSKSKALAIIQLDQFDGRIANALKAMPGLTHLLLHNITVDEQNAEALSRLPQLTFLCLSESPIYDGAIRLIAQRMQLRELVANQSHLTSACLVHLSRMKSLTLVRVTPAPTELMPDQLEDLWDALPQLREFSNFFRPPDPNSKAGVEADFTWSAINELRVLPNDRKAAFANALNRPSTRRVQLQWPGVDSGDLAKLSKLSKLTHVEISQASGAAAGEAVQAVSVRVEGIRSLQALPSLRFLAVEGVPIDTDTCREISKLEHLKTLRLVLCDIDVSGLKELRHSKKLTGLSLRGNALHSADLRELSDLPALEILDVRNTAIDSGSMAAIASFKNISTLYADDTRVDDAGCLRLVNASKLWRLSIAGTRVTDKCLDHFCDMKSLKVLNVARTRITADGLARFRERRPDIVITHAD